MKDMTAKRGLRCAIYTRVSTDQGHEQDFNSLDDRRAPQTRDGIRLKAGALLAREWQAEEAPTEVQGTARWVR